MDALVESGVITQRVPFYVPGSPGLTAFTVYSQRGVNGSVLWTGPSPDIVEDSNVPGWYRLLLNRETTITTAGRTSESLMIIVKCAGMADVPLRVALYRDLPANAVKQNGGIIYGSGTPGDFWRGSA